MRWHLTELNYKKGYQVTKYNTEKVKGDKFDERGNRITEEVKTYMADVTTNDLGKFVEDFVDKNTFKVEARVTRDYVEE